MAKGPHEATGEGFYTMTNAKGFTEGFFFFFQTLGIPAAQLGQKTKDGSCKAADRKMEVWTTTSSRFQTKLMAEERMAQL